MQPPYAVPRVSATIGPLVSRLLGPRGPSEIAGLIVPGVINSIQAVHFRWLRANVEQNPFGKRPHGGEPKLNTPPSVIRVGRAVWIGATLLGPGPRIGDCFDGVRPELCPQWVGFHASRKGYRCGR